MRAAATFESCGEQLRARQTQRGLFGSWLALEHSDRSKCTGQRRFEAQELCHTWLDAVEFPIRPHSAWFSELRTSAPSLEPQVRSAGSLITMPRPSGVSGSICLSARSIGNFRHPMASSHVRNLGGGLKLFNGAASLKCPPCRCPCCQTSASWLSGSVSFLPRSYQRIRGRRRHRCRWHR